MVTKKFSWKFPAKKIFFLKIETFFIAILAILVFFFTFAQFDQRWFYAVIFTIVFLGLYSLISYVIQKIRKIEERYQLSATHLEVVRKKKDKTKKEKVPIKSIKHHKLDKFFLGGYILTHKGKKHPLFFNTKEEIEKFEKFIKKYMKKK